MADRAVDLVVVGAGIHGAGVAQAAAARGWSVLVLEERGLAAGTSSRSSKLIHGGLRYLESGRLGLVRESLRERDLLLRLAPDLVRLRRFYVPLYRKSRRRPWQLRVGLSLYAILAGMSRATRFRRVPRREWSGLDGLQTRDLAAVFQFHDAQTDDALLTRAVMGSAQSLGALVAMPARFVAAHVCRDAVTVEYEHRGAARTCRAATLVNAAGPWVGAVLAGIQPAPRRRPYELVQGTHIEIQGRLEQGIYYVESPQDGRPVFLMPRNGRVLVGTTETPFTGDPDAVRPLDVEREYLRGVVSSFFPALGNTLPGLECGAFAGLRVLPAGNGSLGSRSRETMIDLDDQQRPRVASIYGGKLTTYRATAARVVDQLAPLLPAPRPVADTRTLRLDPPQ